jgi:hypothetical protein
MIGKGLLKEIDEAVSEALKNDAILDLRVRSRGHWEDLLPIILAKCQQSHEAEISRIKNIAFREENEIEQILGKVLGYPYYKDDQKNFPDATEANGVCVGDNVPCSLAMEASNEISKLQARTPTYEQLKARDEQNEITIKQQTKIIDGCEARIKELEKDEGLVKVLEDAQKHLSEVDEKLNHVELAIEQARADERKKIGTWFTNWHFHEENRETDLLKVISRLNLGLSPQEAE